MKHKFSTIAVGALGVSLAPGLSAQTVSSPDPDTDDRNGQIITSFYYSNSTRGFDADGDTVDIDDLQKIEVFVLVEYEVADDLTLIVKPSFSDISVQGGDNTTGLNFTDVGARYQFAQNGDGWLAAEGSVRIPGFSREDSLAQVGSTDTEYDLRLRGFHNLYFGDQNGFIDVQGAYRLRDGDPPNEFRADVTLGYRPSPDFLLLAQSFNVISDGSGQGVFDQFRYHNVQISAVKNVTPAVALQLGLIGTVAGENALRERGAFAGVWYSF